jgi:hypothetical protein
MFRFEIQYINKISVQYENKTRESHILIRKDFNYWTFLVGHEKLSKNVISQTMNYILGDIKLK